MIERGKYIVIEGNDGTGKSTQVELFTQYLRDQGFPTVMIEEPGSEDPDKATPVANHLRRIIKDGSLVRDPEINLALFSAARREIMATKNLPRTSQGCICAISSKLFLDACLPGER